MPPEFDPVDLPPEERKNYRYAGPEIIYTFWAKHGPCSKPGCGHRTPVFRSPVLAEKTLGVKYIELTCKSCKTVFHAELGDARIAPAAEQIILPGDVPFTMLSQPFAKRLMDYGQGNKGDKQLRTAELSGMVEEEPGLKCPKCSTFAGQFLRDVLTAHRRAARAADIDKKHLEDSAGATARSRCTAISWSILTGSRDRRGRWMAMGWAAMPMRRRDATACWYQERVKNLGLVEVRGRIKIAEDTSHEMVRSAGAQENRRSNPISSPTDRPKKTRPKMKAAKTASSTASRGICGWQTDESSTLVRAPSPSRPILPVGHAACHRISANRCRQRSTVRRWPCSPCRATAPSAMTRGNLRQAVLRCAGALRRRAPSCCRARMVQPPRDRPSGLLATRRNTAYLHDPPRKLPLTTARVHALVEDVQCQAAPGSRPVVCVVRRTARHARQIFDTKH